MTDFQHTTATGEDLPTAPDFSAQVEDVFAKRFENDKDETNDPPPSADTAPVEPAAAPPDDAAEPAAGDAGDSISDAIGAATVTDDAPATGGVADAADAAESGEPPVPAVDAVVEPSQPTSLSVPLPNGESFDLTTDTATQLLALAAWDANLQPQTREAFAAIEQGQAIAVPRTEFEQFQAWQARNGTTTNDLYDDLDPETAARVRAIEAENARFRESAATAPHTAQITARTDQAEQAFVDTAQTYATERGLTEDEMGRVFQAAIEANVIPKFADDMRRYSPTGQLIMDADYSQVARKAFDFALFSNPDLHTRSLQDAANPVLTDPIPGLPPTADLGPDPTAAKKARAGSLASAPSAAVAPPIRDIASATPQELSRAMAEELRSVMASG